MLRVAWLLVLATVLNGAPLDEGFAAGIAKSEPSEVLKELGNGFAAGVAVERPRIPQAFEQILAQEFNGAKALPPVMMPVIDDEPPTSPKPAKESTVDEWLLRNRLFPLSSMAYGLKQSDCFEKVFNNTLIDRSVLTQCGNGYAEPAMCFAFTGALHNDKAIFVAFRGTHNFLQLVYEINRVVFKRMRDSTVGGKVSEYFYNVYERLLDGGIRDSILSLRQRYPDYKVWLTGHSLGGALATVAAAELVESGIVSDEELVLGTFGQPRTGNAEFADEVKKRISKVWRVVNGRDMVPHGPPTYYNNYHHNGNEVFYPSGMAEGAKFVECEDGESTDCSNRNYVDHSIYNHLYYYGTHVSMYGESACRKKGYFPLWGAKLTEELDPEEIATLQRMGIQLRVEDLDHVKVPWARADRGDGLWHHPDE